MKSACIYSEEADVPMARMSRKKEGFGQPALGGVQDAYLYVIMHFICSWCYSLRVCAGRCRDSPNLPGPVGKLW
jgi:hypothetical protein